MVFLDRSRRAGPYLEWKVRIFVLAAVLGLAGIYLQERWLTGSAIGLLFAGLALRVLATGEGGEDDPHDEDDEDDGSA
jgi:hypothetical protein